MTKLSVHQRKARDFIQREDWGNALAELERMVEADGSNPTLHNQIGDVYLRKDEVEEACSHFERAIELYATVGLHNNAVALCKKVMRLRPGRNDVRFRLARLRLDQGFRSEASLFFADYLDHVHPKGDHGGAELEARCREMVDLLPDDAPVGKILEKLESASLFACAFEIVHRYAKLAADSGDASTARRYSEKMRSLRVLAERNGGRDLLASFPLPDEAAPAAAEALDRVEPTPAVAVAAPPAAAGGVSRLVEPGRIDLPAAGTAPAADAPSIDFDLDIGSLEAARVGPEPAGLDSPTFDGLPLLGGSKLPQPAAAPSRARSPEPESVPAAEIPAAALDSETARGTFDLDDAAPLDVATFEAVTSDGVDDDNFGVAPDEAWPGGRADAGAYGAAAAAAQAELAGAFAAPASGVPLLQPEDDVAAGADDEDDVTIGEPKRRAAGPSRWVDALRHSPVWIPHGETLTGPQESPPDSGTNMELEQVIDSFRDQMARALDGDGAARYDLGVAYYDMGLYNEALAEFEAAARCPGLEIRSVEMQAACMLQTERFTEVVQLLAPVVTASGGAAQQQLGLHYVLGQAYEALGDRAGARRHFEEVALVDIDFKDVQVRLQRVS